MSRERTYATVRPIDGKRTRHATTKRGTFIGRALGAPLLITAGLPRAVSAQQADLPATISLVVGAYPGGTTDTLARDISDVLRAKLGSTIAVENRA